MKPISFKLASVAKSLTKSVAVVIQSPTAMDAHHLAQPACVAHSVTCIPCAWRLGRPLMVINLKIRTDESLQTMQAARCIVLCIFRRFSWSMSRAP